MQKKSQHYPTTTNNDFGGAIGGNSHDIDGGVHIDTTIHAIAGNNSSAAGIQMTKDINNVAVSISSTSINAGAINTNDDIRAMHQTGNYIPEKLAINDGSNSNVVCRDPDTVIDNQTVTSAAAGPTTQTAASNKSGAVVNQQEKFNMKTDNQKKNAIAGSSYKIDENNVPSTAHIEQIEDNIYGEKIDYSIQEENRQEFNNKIHSPSLQQNIGDYISSQMMNTTVLPSSSSFSAVPTLKENKNENDNTTASNDDIIEKHENDDEKTEKSTINMGGGGMGTNKSTSNIITLNENVVAKENANGNEYVPMVHNNNIQQETFDTSDIDQALEQSDNHQEIYEAQLTDTNNASKTAYQTNDNRIIQENIKAAMPQQQQPIPPQPVSSSSTAIIQPHQIQHNETNEGKFYEIDPNSYGNQSDTIIPDSGDGTYATLNYPDGDGTINYDDGYAVEHNQYELDNQQQYDATQLAENEQQQQQYENYNYQDDGQYFGNEMSAGQNSALVEGMYEGEQYGAVDATQMDADGQPIVSYQVRDFYFSKYLTTSKVLTSHYFHYKCIYS